MSKFAEVVLPLAVQGTYTYRIPPTMSVGAGFRVLVPFGRKKYYTAIVVMTHDIEPQGYQVKEILALLDEGPVLRHPQLKFWQWIADYYLCTVGEVYKAAVPSGLKVESETFICTNPDFEEEEPGSLNDREKVILDFTAQRGKVQLTELTNATGFKNVESIVSRLLDKGAVHVAERMMDNYRPKTETCVRFTIERNDEAALHEFFDRVKRAKKQEQLLLAYLDLSHWMQRSKPVKEVTQEALLKRSGCTQPVLAAARKNGLFEIYKREINRFEMLGKGLVELPKLTEVQNTAYKAIHNSFKEKEITLLRGVTSSGKTSIYMHLINDALSLGKQVLYLVPEIALTTQLTQRLQRVFGERLLIYHSKFSDNERVDIWKKLLTSDEPCVIIGVRSSIFLPYSNLGLVIVDEEHDTSYKQQDPAPRYHARNAALVLARQAGAKVLLGTATPAVETYYNAMQGKYGLVELLLRHGNIPLPRITTIDTRLCYKRKEMTGHFSDPLVHKLSGELERHKQVIVFRNRRGYAPWLSCPQCGYVPKCVNCDISLTVHKRQGTLVCHYCGYTIPLPQSCPVCGETALADHGMGTEKIEDELHELFPKARVARMDLDTTRTKYGYQRIIDDFADRKTDILVGTQMVTKGLDFDGVSTVAVLSADSLSNMPDFRSSERAYQQLEQVSGRAGRRDEQGEVIIQTATPDSALLRYVAAHDYKAMYAEQITEREAFRYPPFYRLIEVSVSHHDLHQADVAAAALQTRLQAVFTRRCSRVIQPVIGKVQNRYIRTILLKIEASAPYAKAKQLIHEQIRLMQQTVSARSAVISIDVDPM